jgi:kinesin family protein 14
MVVHATSNVIKSTRDTFELAQQLQDVLGTSETSTAQAKRAFYRKSFKRAKGIINEVRDMADTINSLAASCSKAVTGSDDVSSLMSNAKNLRGAVARLIHSSEFKLGRKTMENHQLNTSLRNACSDVTRASKQLTSDCEEYNQSDAARAKRADGTGTLSRAGTRSSARPSGMGAKRHSSSNASKKNPTSEVMRRTMLVEQQSEVYRLEAELADAQKTVKELQRSMYKVQDASNEATTTI